VRLKISSFKILRTPCCRVRLDCAFGGSLGWFITAVGLFISWHVILNDSHSLLNALLVILIYSATVKVIKDNRWHGHLSLGLMVWIPKEQRGPDTDAVLKWADRDLNAQIPTNTPVTRLTFPLYRAPKKSVLIDYILVLVDSGACQ